MFTRYRYLCKSIDLQISTVDLKKWGIIVYSIPPVQKVGGYIPPSPDAHVFKVASQLKK